MLVETTPLKLFYCYAREDKVLRDELEIHLAGLKRQYNLTHWSDREITPGADWEQVIDEHLNTADIILLLISPHFVASDYCYGKEMQRALERHEAGMCCVIPILLRPTYWEDMPFSGIQLLPTDAEPITNWANRDKAFHDVAKGVSAAIKIQLKERCLEKGKTLFRIGEYEEALSALEQVLRLDPGDVSAWYGKGKTLYALKKYDDALTACEEALCIDSNYPLAWRGKGAALCSLNRYEEALSAYDQALHLDPNDALTWKNKGMVLRKLNRYEEAEYAEARYAFEAP